MGAREMDVLDVTGHSKHIWDSEVAAEVAAMRTVYDSLTAKGYKAFFVGKDGSEGKPMKSFDEDAEKMIMVPPLVGG